MTGSVSGLFDTCAEALEAVRQLHSIGISADDISVLAAERDGQLDNSVVAGAGIGAAMGGLGGLLAGLGLVTIPGIGPVVAVGWLLSAAAGAAGGAVVGGAAGGIVAVLAEFGIPESDAQVYAESIRRGGALVIARVDENDRPAALRVLAGLTPVDIDTRRAAYEGEGWTKFDANRLPTDDL